MIASPIGINSNYYELKSLKTYLQFYTQRITQLSFLISFGSPEWLDKSSILDTQSEVVQVKEGNLLRDLSLPDT
jgi:hypothetical protein